MDPSPLHSPQDDEASCLHSEIHIPPLTEWPPVLETVQFFPVTDAAKWKPDAVSEKQ
jgi:hypothetical protein